MTFSCEQIAYRGLGPVTWGVNCVMVVRWVEWRQGIRTGIDRSCGWNSKIERRSRVWACSHFFFACHHLCQALKSANFHKSHQPLNTDWQHHIDRLHSLCNDGCYGTFLTATLYQTYWPDISFDAWHHRAITNKWCRLCCQEQACNSQANLYTLIAFSYRCLTFLYVLGLGISFVYTGLLILIWSRLERSHWMRIDFDPDWRCIEPNHLPS